MVERKIKQLLFTAIAVCMCCGLHAQVNSGSLVKPDGSSIAEHAGNGNCGMKMSKVITAERDSLNFKFLDADTTGTIVFGRTLPVRIEKDTLHAANAANNNPVGSVEDTNPHTVTADAAVHHDGDDDGESDFLNQGFIQDEAWYSKSYLSKTGKNLDGRIRKNVCGHNKGGCRCHEKR
jgi:hypothetical protein